MGVQAAPSISPHQVTGLIWAETVIALVFVAIRIAFKKSKYGPTRRLSFTDVSKRGITGVVAMAVKTLSWAFHGLDWDDFFVVLAWVVLLAQALCYTAVIQTIWDLMAVAEHPQALANAAFLQSLPARAALYLKVQFAMIILFWTQIWLVKAAFLAYYKKLFVRGFVGWQKLAWWWLAIFCMLTYIANWPLQFLSCSPISAYFVPGRCTTTRDIRISNASLYYAAAADIACDLLIMLLPMTLLGRLRTRRTAEKVTVATVFGAAILIVALAALRLIFTTPGSDSHVDPRWLAIWSSSECSIAVMVAAGPAFSHILSRRRSSEQVQESPSHSQHKSLTKGAAMSQTDVPHEMTVGQDEAASNAAAEGARKSRRLDREERGIEDRDWTPVPSPERAHTFDKHCYSFD